MLHTSETQLADLSGSFEEDISVVLNCRVGISMFATAYGNRFVEWSKGLCLAYLWDISSF